MIYKIKNYIKDHPIAIIICIAIIIIIVLSNIIDNDMEKHIEKVSQECASQGYGIKAKYTKEGDKYYVCNK
jgi:hypothetical protein